MLTPEALHNPQQFKMLHELHHDGLIRFIQAHLRNFNPVTATFYLFNLLILLFLARKVYLEVFTGQSSWDEVISGLGFGFLLTFLVVFLVHENIHLLVYRFLGAKEATVKVYWSKLMFLALADRFVVNKRAFYLLALSPFVVITMILLAVYPFAASYFQYMILGVLVLHTGGCSGDFALVSFFFSKPNREILTYDDVKENKTYFFERI